MKKENNFDEIDELLFKVFKDMPDVPESTRYTIQNAFDLPTKEKKKHHIYTKLQKVAIFIISFTILTTGVVFAKDIINYITNLLTNSTKAIDTAIENGYVQNVNMDFIIDKDIGIRVTQLIMDNQNLDIAFEYYSNRQNISNLEIIDYVIKDEQDNIIDLFLNNYNDIDMSKAIASRCDKSNEVIRKDNKYQESFLITTNEHMPNSKKIIIEVKSFIVTEAFSNKKEKIEGNWNMSVVLSDDMIKRKTETYSAVGNEYISNISATINETSLKIELDLVESINDDMLAEVDFVTLTNINGEKYNPIMGESNSKGDHLIFIFDIGSYCENIDKLNLNIKLDVDKKINIELYK